MISLKMRVSATITHDLCNMALDHVVAAIANADSFADDPAFQEEYLRQMHEKLPTYQALAQAATMNWRLSRVL